VIEAEMLISKDGQVKVAAVEARLSSEVRRGDLAERRHVRPCAFERSNFCQHVGRRFDPNQERHSM